MVLQMTVKADIAKIKRMVDTVTTVNAAIAVGRTLSTTYANQIVVNGSVVPAVAKEFKAAGIPIVTLRHSEDGVIAAYVVKNGFRVYLYQNTELASFAHEHFFRKVAVATGLFKTVADYVLRKLSK